MTKKKNFTDPRARRLISGAYVALGSTPIMACFLGSVLLGSGGQMITATWVVVAMIATCATAALVCLIVAPRVEAETLARHVARKREYLARLAARSAMPPADPTPAYVVPAPTGPVLPPPVTVAPVPATEAVSTPAPAPVQPDPVVQPAPAQAQ